MTKLTIIDKDDALEYLQRNGYHCTRVDGDGIFGMPNVVPGEFFATTMMALFAAGFLFFAWRLYKHERSVKRRRS